MQSLKRRLEAQYPTQQASMEARKQDLQPDDSLCRLEIAVLVLD